MFRREVSTVEGYRLKCRILFLSFQVVKAIIFLRAIVRIVREFVQNLNVLKSENKIQGLQNSLNLIRSA